MVKSDTAVAEPEIEDDVLPKPQASKPQPKRQPRYHVVLWDDPNHTFEYVIRMLQELFRHELGMARKMAVEVDSAGKVICLTTSLEHAELKRDQIKAYGRDPWASHSTGSMSASIIAAR